MSERLSLIQINNAVPDRFIDRGLIDVTRKLVREAVKIEDLDGIAASITGYNRYPHVVSGLLRDIRRFESDIDLSSLRLQDVVYDHAGLIGFKLSNGSLSGAIFQWADNSGERSPVNLLVGGSWYCGYVGVVDSKFLPEPRMIFASEDVDGPHTQAMKQELER